jgi:hypothetical protein
VCLCGGSGIVHQRAPGPDCKKRILVGTKELVGWDGRSKAGKTVVIAKRVRSTMVSDAKGSCSFVEMRRESVSSGRSGSVSGEEGS